MNAATIARFECMGVVPASESLDVLKIIHADEVTQGTRSFIEISLLLSSRRNFQKYKDTGSA